MANDGNEISPLLQHLVSSPPELDDDTYPSPSEIKNRLIFGSPPQRYSPPSQIPLPSSSSATSLSDYSTTVNFHGFKRSKSAINDMASNPTNDPTTHPPNGRKTDQSSDPKYNARTAVALLVLLYLSLGVLIYWLNPNGFKLVNHTHPVVDGLYFCVVTMCTIGYGDITPDSITMKLFTIVFVLGGFVLIYILLNSGILTCVCDFQEMFLFRNAISPYIFDLAKGRMWTRVKVGIALDVVMCCLGFGVLILHFVEGIGWFDSFYYSFMSVTTVGYGGDRGGGFKTLTGRLLASVWLLVSTLSVLGAIMYLVEVRMDVRKRRIAKIVLDRDMSVSDFFCASINRNDYLSKSEFLIYKLKEMGRINGEDITPIINQFDKLDPTYTGRITLSDLLTETSV